MYAYSMIMPTTVVQLVGRRYFAFGVDWKSVQTDLEATSKKVKKICLNNEFLGNIIS